ncbi:MAG: pyridoxamine 5'-phosphate oxidase family protein [Clostridiales bacterium]|jgi:uncharacterized pyridoxamine 5'-phosphate oxidase family protein|nr:pyridoxamine 5'-phosphate oxidase family protein [Clostridiales bacterium]
MQEIYDFLKKCKTYYLATVENDSPRVRPFGTIELFDGKLCFQTGKIKEISKQLSKNPKIEICAFDGTRWLRLSASAEDDDRIEAKRHMLDAYPELKDRYSAEDGNTQIFRLKDGKATFSTFGQEDKIIEF